MASDAREHAHGFQDLGRGLRAALAAPTSRQTQLGMDAAFPVNDQDDFTGLRIYVDDHLANQCPNDALLETFSPRVPSPTSSNERYSVRIKSRKVKTNRSIGQSTATSRAPLSQEHFLSKQTGPPLFAKGTALASSVYELRGRYAEGDP